MKNGSFIISLDFELFWGVLDAIDYFENVDRIHSTREVALELIETFEENKLSVSWSTVGLLMLNDSRQLNEMKHRIFEPNYKNQKFNNLINYEILLNNTYFCEEAFFAKDIVEKLKKTEFQRIGSHTFSHYYCLEEGQTKEEFINDLKLAKEIASNMNIDIESIVFPRNQYSNEYLDILKQQTINIYRGNPNKYIYKARRTSDLIVRALRLIDTYINITGHITHQKATKKNGMYNIKASRFLRPQNNSNKILKKLQLRRIKNEMTHAAKKGHYYHLWWHPHNFSSSPNENFEFLKEIINHFLLLEKKYNFSSESMETYVRKVKLDE